MKRQVSVSRVSRSAIAVCAPLLFTVGCPALLQDDFASAPAEGRGGGPMDGSLQPGDGATASAAGGAGATDAGSGGAAGASGGSAVLDAGRSDGSAGTGAGGAGGGGAGGGGGDSGSCTPCGSLAACCPPHWSPLAAPDPSFVGREKAAACAFGTGVLVWGGSDASGTELGTGAVYDSLADTWSSVVVDAATPSARVLATAVWTGASVVVWGGGDAASLTDYATGARYDPAAKTWAAMTTTGAPSARRAPYGVWTGTRVLFWGGVSAVRQPVSGAYLYDPVNDAWTAASTTNEPVPPLNPTVGWTGAELVIYGGRPGGTSFTGHTDQYDPALDVWKRDAAGPSGRQGALGAWDGAAFIAWGGAASLVRGDGQRYVPSTNNWMNMVSAGAPSARFAEHRETGWSSRIGDTTTIVLGGYDKTQTALTDGGIYDSTTNTWLPVAAWPSGKAHLWGVGVWAGSRFVLWGGRVAPLGALTTLGERFTP